MKKLITPILIVFAISLFIFQVNAQELPKVYVAPMENGFDSFVTAALLKNKVPVKVITEEDEADYVIVGSSVKGNNKWYDTVFGAERDRNQGSIKLLRVDDKSVAWAGASGDKSVWWGAMKGGGEAKVSNRLARKLKKEYFNNKYKFVRKEKAEAKAGENSDSNDISDN